MSLSAGVLKVPNAMILNKYDHPPASTDRPKENREHAKSPDHYATRAAFNWIVRAVPKSASISLRPSNASDRDLFYKVTLETMRDYVIATWGSWNDERVRAESAEKASSPDGRVVLVDGHSAGVMIARRYADHMQLEQLYLAPIFQAKGVGTSLMRDLLADAKISGMPVRLRVLRANPAKRFYEKLGFKVTQETPERFHMEWSL